MQIWNLLKSFFYVGDPKALPPKLDAISEAAQSRSIRILPHGERGWITMQEARSLFSPIDGQYAFLGIWMSKARPTLRHSQHRSSNARLSVSCLSRAASTSLEKLPFQMHRLERCYGLFVQPPLCQRFQPRSAPCARVS